MKLIWALELLLFFIKELIAANLQVAFLIAKGAKHVRPAIVRIPTQLTSETALLMLANMITLTPGTLTLEVSSDHRYLFVHVLHADDPDKIIHGIQQGFESRLKRVFG